MYTYIYPLWCLQIIAESLPISSSGHVTLALRSSGHKSLPESVIDLMHLPTLIIISLFVLRQMPALGITHLTDLYAPALQVILADSITVLFYLVMSYSGFRTIVPLWAGFACSSIVIYILSQASWGTALVPTWSQACLLGIAQGIALLPGVSRLAATLVMGYTIGLSPNAAITWSCALQIPLICAALIKASIYERSSLRWLIPPSWFWRSMLCISCVIAYQALWGVLWLLEYNALTPLCWYLLFCSCIALYLRYN